MNKSALQKFLLALGVVALVFLLVEVVVSLSATMHGAKAARIERVAAGPYHFTVSLYDDPARAGFTLPFAIAPEQPAQGAWAYHVTSIPDGELLKNGKILMSGAGRKLATPVQASVSPDPQIAGGIQGAAEITVEGSWHLQVVVDGPTGAQTFNVALTATTLPALPIWLGWALGFIPVYGIAVFLLMLIEGHKRQRKQVASLMG